MIAAQTAAVPLADLIIGNAAIGLAAAVLCQCLYRWVWWPCRVALKVWREETRPDERRPTMADNTKGAPSPAERNAAWKAAMEAESGRVRPECDRLDAVDAWGDPVERDTGDRGDRVAVAEYVRAVRADNLARAEGVS